jgi:predicted ATPase/class 3 adenylate cyclase/Tfp pilus assembly protein PilF
MASLPTGTITFLFSDIEGSTRLLQRLGDRYAGVLAEHRALLRSAFQRWDGHEIDTAGDGFFIAFNRATQAVAAAVAAQRAIAAHAWPDDVSVRVRIGLHTGEPLLAAGGYVGLDVHRAARICAAGHGGQILLSKTTRDLVEHDLPKGVSLRDHGEHRLKDLQRPEHLFQLVLAEGPADFPPLKTPDSHPNNLPGQVTSFIGREREETAVRELLQRHEVRLVTLTGPGGTGKTRLAVHVAADLIDDFDHGVFFVPLAPINDPTLVASTIAQTLGIVETGGRPLLDHLKDALRGKHLLLVLDNFEQVVSGASLVAELLAACPRLKVIVTSRIVLRLSGEHEFPVPPLALPNPKYLPALEALSQYAAVELFIQRALAVKPDFAVTNENAPAIAEICVQLDGLPLAIELAAARIKPLPPRAMLARLGRRLELLKGGARDLPARHQTLRHAIAWSYELLDATEKALFTRLAVCVGGCTLEATEAICHATGGLDLEVLDSVASLVDKSLLRQEEQADGEPRFGMLETIREYALECLEASPEAAAIRQAHAHYYAALAEEAESHLTGPQQARWLNRLETEHDNLRAALHWLVGQGEVDAGLQLGGALWRFWIIRGHMSEGRERLAALLALPGTSTATPARAKVLNGLGTIAHEQGDYAAARSWLEESLALWRRLGDNRGMAMLLNNLGWVAWHLGDYGAARALSEEALTRHRELGDSRGIALALNNLGWVATFQGDHRRACALHEESLRLRRELGDKRGIAFAMTNLAEAVHPQGDYPRAAALLEEALALLREVGDRQLIANACRVLGHVAHDQGDDRRAAALLEESLALAREIGNEWIVAFALDLLGDVARRQGNPAQAMALYAESLTLRQAAGDTWGIATTLSHQARLRCHQGDDGAARELYAESLRLHRDLDNQHGMAECLTGLARVAVAQGQCERAARLLGAMEARRDAIGAPVPPCEQADYERLTAGAHSAIGATAFAAARAAGKTMTIEQAMAEDA